jgi:hypothetical protein
VRRDKRPARWKEAGTPYTQMLFRYGPSLLLLAWFLLVLLPALSELRPQQHDGEEADQTNMLLIILVLSQVWLYISLYSEVKLKLERIKQLSLKSIIQIPITRGQDKVVSH